MADFKKNLLGNKGFGEGFEVGEKALQQKSCKAFSAGVWRDA